MKKLVFASVVALASVGFVAAPTLRAQDQGGQITIKDPAEYNAYQMFSTQTDPKAKGRGRGQLFWKSIPRAWLKRPSWTRCSMSITRRLHDNDKALDTANKLLQIDPNNLKAILYSVLIKKQAMRQEERSGHLRRCRRPGPERPAGSKAGRHRR